MEKDLLSHKVSPYPSPFKKNSTAPKKQFAAPPLNSHSNPTHPSLPKPKPVPTASPLFTRNRTRTRSDAVRPLNQKSQQLTRVRSSSTRARPSSTKSANRSNSSHRRPSTNAAVTRINTIIITSTSKPK